MIIYLHGFGATGAANKAKWLAKEFPYEIIEAPTYPSNDADEAVKIIDEVITKAIRVETNIMLVGSSMGGFLAQYMGQKYNLKTILINPAMNFSKIARALIGDHVNFLTNEEFSFTEDSLKTFAKYEVKSYDSPAGVFVILDSGDEVLDYKVARDAYQDIGHVLVFDGGSHRFQHMDEAAPYIQNMYSRPIDW